MTKISIIIPYHNVEEYISTCLYSVVNQTLKDIEIICVNDSSTDNSLNTVQEYASKDDRIRMLNLTEQSGQGYARNRAMEIATGEYIGFVDSDDWVEFDMFEKMYNKAKSDNADITMCQAVLYDDKTKEYIHNDYYDLKSIERFENKVFSSVEVKDEILNINVVLWNKLYRRDFLNSSKERFPEGFIYEDLPFFFSTFLKAERVNVIYEPLYYYRQNRQYSTMQNVDKKVYDRIPMVALTYEKLKQASFYKEKETDILSWIIDDIFHRYTLLEEKYYKEYFYMMKKFFRSFAPEGDDIYKLATCYCYEEYVNILKNHYFDFWKFLIEKYKVANKKVKAAQHEKNLFVIDYDKKQKKEIEELNNNWQTTLDDKEEGWQKIFEKQKKDADNQYRQMHDKLITQEYALKRWQAQSVREKTEKITADYEWKLNDQKSKYLAALKRQKNYYENNFLLVKINIKVKKIICQMKNKIKNILKEN